MKKSIFTVSMMVITAAAILVGCNSSSEKVENAQTEVKEANKELEKANEEYLTDIDNCRKLTAEKIEANDKSIIEFNERISKEKKEARAEYKKKIDALDLKNSDMKKKLADYKADGKANWEIFKTEFNHDMDEMGKAFKDLTVKNVK